MKTAQPHPLEANPSKTVNKEINPLTGQQRGYGVVGGGVGVVVLSPKECAAEGPPESKRPSKSVSQMSAMELMDMHSKAQQAEIERLRATLTDLWGYTQGLEKIIRDGVYRSEELKDPDAWKDCDVWQFDGTGASITMQVEEVLAGFSAETGAQSGD